MDTQELSKKFIDNIPYHKAVQLQDKNGYVQCEGFGKIHINNWPKKSQTVRQYFLEKWLINESEIKLKYFEDGKA